MPEIKNYMETCVKDMLVSVLDSLNCCKCETCRFDILAITLNQLPSKYVVTRKGELYTKLYALHQQFDVDIISSIAKAAEIVNSSPRHDGK